MPPGKHRVADHWEITWLTQRTSMFSCPAALEQVLCCHQRSQGPSQALSSGPGQMGRGDSELEALLGRACSAREHLRACTTAITFPPGWLE